MRSLRAWTTFVSFVAAAAACAPSAGTPPAQGGGRYRVQASGTAAEELVSHGAVLVADYGTFRILDAPPSALASVAPSAVELRNEYLRIALDSGDIDTSTPSLAAAQRAPAIGDDGKALHLVQFVGPPKPEWFESLASTGARIVTYVPQNAYLVWGDLPALDRVHALAAGKHVQLDAPYLPKHKIDRALATSDTGSYEVQLVEDAAPNDRTIALVHAFERRPARISSALGYVNLVVETDRSAVDAIAARPDVVSIQPWVEPTLFDERQDIIVAGRLTNDAPNGPGYLDWLLGKGFTQAQFDASGFGVDVSDSGIDNGTTTPNNFGLYSGGDVGGTSRVAYVRVEGTPHAGSTAQGCDGHGNLNAHIVAGYTTATGSPFADSSGYRYGLGVAPFVKVGGSVIFDPDTFTSPDFEDLQSRAWANGMRISTNSWGSATNTYGATAQRYDALVRDAAPDGSASPVAGNQEMVIVFSAGNSGPSSSTMGTPGNAKNVLSAGASENVHPFGGSDGCAVGDTSASSAFDVASFSSRGPAPDGRKRPDLMAPGTHVSGGVAQAAGQRANPPAVATGDANSCYVGTGVCGGVGSIFFPASQEWYTASSGTSHSAPAIAGAAALLRQYFINQGFAPPSPAMTKAYLMNSARYMTGSGANDTLYSNNQGMGLLDLGAAFDGTARLLRDEVAEDLFTASAQVRTFTGSCGDATKPFRVTLAWTDAPGSTAGPAYNNNLDLTVDIGGNTYKGNVFSGASSVTGGTADLADNVESVFLPAGITGPYTVTVTATNINSDGVPGNGSALDQDFALVVSNSCATAVPSVPTGVTATASADNEITVSWTTSTATSYLVYRATSASGPWSLVSTSSASPFVDTGRSGGTTYYYVVRAQEGCAVSAASTAASATATGACLTPPTFAGLASAATTGGLVCGNTLSWAAGTTSCGGTLAYDVHRSTSASFVPDATNRIAQGASGTGYTDSGTLVSGTAYYYAVRAVETTANGPVYDANTVRRSATPSRISEVFEDDFDANRPGTPAAWWIERTTTGSESLLIANGCRYQSATNAYRFGSTAAACGTYYGNSIRNALVLGGDGTTPGVNGIAIPAGGGTLSFRIWYSFENYYDSAWLTYSTTGASGTFTQVGDSVSASAPYISSGGYDATTLAGVRGWTSSRTAANGSLPEVVVNLDALAGQTVWFAWQFYTDSSVTYEGFYVDDVVVRNTGSCLTTAPPPGAAVRYGIAGLPTTVVADAAQTVTVTAYDMYDSVSTGYSGTATVASSDVQAVLPATVSFTSGVATAAVRLRTAGSQTITATDSTSSAISGTARTQVVGGAAASLAFTVQPTNRTAGAAFSPAVAVTVRDAFGNLTSGVPVTIALSPNPSGGALAGTTTVSTVNGVATFSGVSVARAGTGYGLSATASSLPAVASSTFDVVAGPAARLAFAQQPSAAVAGEPISPAPSVAVQDSYGNQTTSAAVVNLSLGSAPTGATLSGTMSVAASSGVATFGDLTVDLAGSGYVLLATSGSLASASSDSFEAVGGAPYRVVFTQQPGSVAAGAPFSPPVAATLLDRFDNLSAAATTRVSLSFASNPSLASLVGTTSVDAVAGAVSFPGVAVNKAGNAFALYVGASALYGDTSVGFDVLPAPSYSLQGPATAAVGVAQTFVASALDENLAPMSGYVGTADVTTTDAAAQVNPTTATFAGGQASIQITFGTLGPHLVTFTESSGTMTGSASVTVTEAPPPNPPSDDGGGCGCGAGGGSGAALFGLALLLGRPRRRGARGAARPIAD